METDTRGYSITLAGLLALGSSTPAVAASISPGAAPIAAPRVAAPPPTARASPAPGRTLSRDTNAAATSGSICAVATQPGGAGKLELTLQTVAWKGWPEMCARLADYLQLGAPPFRASVAQKVGAALAATGYFSDPQCSVHDGGNPIRCTLRPQPIVRSIEVTGSLPFVLFKRDVRRRIFLRPGTLLPDDPTPALAKQQRRLEDYLLREGYFGSKVPLRLHRQAGAAPNAGMELVAQVHSGHSAQLGEVIVLGDPVLTVAQARKALRHYGLLYLYKERFQPQRLEDDLDSITRSLQRRGWPAALVHGTYRLNPRTGRIDVTITVNSGPRLVLHFSGNHTIDDGDLRRQATFVSAGAVDAVEMDNTAKAIRLAYQKEGYDEVAVSWRSAEPAAADSPERLVVTYTIVEGQQHSIERVQLVGNAAFSARHIRAATDMLTSASGLFGGGEWVDAWIDHDLRAIRRFYHQQGFAKAEVSVDRITLPDGHLEARFAIDAGPRRMVGRVSLVNVPPGVRAADVRAALALKASRPFVAAQLDDDKQTVLAYLVAQGYTQARVAQWVDGPPASRAGTMSIRYDIEPGPRALFGGILVRGNFRTARSVFTQELDLDPGEPLNLLALSTTQRRLRSLGIFGSVQLQPLPSLAARNRKWLLLSVEERDRRVLDAVASFTTDEFFSIGADYTDRNLLGHAIRLDLTARFANASGIIFPRVRIGNADRFNLRLAAPRPFGAPFDVEGGAYYEYFEQKSRFYDPNQTPLFTTRRFGGSLGIVRHLLRRNQCHGCPDITGSLTYELLSSRFLLNVPAAISQVPANVLQAPTVPIGRLIPKLTFDHRDSFVDPRSGWAADVRFEMAYAPLAFNLPKASSFWRFIVSAQGYLNLGTPVPIRSAAGKHLGGPVVLAGSAQYGMAAPWAGDRAVPLAESFAYGGDQSVRGLAFKASTLGFPGATYLFVGNAELRWYVLQNLSFGAIQLAGFTDLGTVAYHFGGLFDQITLTAGPALRWVTPVGPLSLAYGWPIVRAPAIVATRPRAIPKHGRLHFAFGYTF